MKALSENSTYTSPPTPHKVRRCAELFFFLVMAGAVALIPLLATFFSLGEAGTTDFVQYWSAFRALQQSLNPYDGLVLHNIQATVGQSPEHTILMWNPPWTCLILAPFLMLSFSSSAAAWFVFSLALLPVICWSTVPSCSRLAPRYAVLASLVFLPVIEGLSLGQLSIFLTSSLVLTLRFLERGRPVAAGLSLIPLTIKPHLFFLLIPIALAWLFHLPAPERKKLITTISAAMACLLCLTEYLWPGAIRSWMDALGATPRGPGAVPLYLWKTATAVTVVRSLLNYHYHTLPDWPLVVVPAVSLTVVSGWVIAYRSHIQSWRAAAIGTVCLSLLFGNYGWLFDQTLLLPSYLLIISSALDTDRLPLRYALLSSVAAVAALAMATALLVSNPAQHYYTWIPAAIGLLFYLSRRTTQPGPSLRDIP